MVVKNKWTSEDFDEMSWHDCQLYSIRFYENNSNLCLDIDYIFKWELNEKTGKYKFWISPCKFTFISVSNLKISLDFANSIGVSIDHIRRFNERKSPNDKINMWDFVLKTDVGSISFSATDYIQEILAQPILSRSQILGRSDENKNAETSLN